MLIERSIRRWALVLMLGFSCLSAPELSPIRAQAQGPGSDRQEVEMRVALGEQLVLPAQGVKSYSEGTRSIIDVRLTGDSSRFVVVGLNRGVTSLLFLMADGTERHYRITVFDPNFVDNKPPVAPDADPLAVAPQVNVRLDLYFVQLDRTYNHGVGMSYKPAVGAASLKYAFDIPTRALTSNCAFLGASLLPQLELAQSQGWAKVSRHVAVITSNGTEARFDSGGDFNTQIVQGLTAGVNTIRYGSALGVKPRYDEESKRIELAVDAELSDLAATSANLPGKNHSSIKTVVNLSVGESLAVAGLSGKLRDRNRSGIPYLSQIPIIGYLFGKETVREQDVENMIFIVPSIVEPLHRARGKEYLTDALETYENYSGRRSGLKPFLPTPELLKPANASAKP